MELDQMLKLIDAVSKSKLSKFTWKEGNIEVNFEADREPVVSERIVTKAESPVSVIEAVLEEENERNDITSGKTVNSPLVGTFYNAASPDSEPFVQVGDTVKKGQVIGIVEAMKLMNEIESEFDGVIEEILVENESMVEYGQPLFRIS